MTLHAQQYLKQATVIYSAEKVGAAIDNIAAQLNRTYQEDPPVLLCVMTGGAYFAGQLLPKLTFPLEFDYIHATRYRNATQGYGVEWVHYPKEIIRNRRVLLLDDILDEGHTLAAIVDECAQRHATDVKIAVLAEKILGIVKPINADYVGVEVPNRYVFGCGMDVYGWWRNLPAIYALNTES